MIRRLRIKFICITMVIVTVMMTVLLVSQLNFTKNSLIQRNMKALEDASREFREEQLLMGPLPGEWQASDGKPDRNAPLPGFLKPERGIPCFILRLDGSGELEVSGSAYYDLTDRSALLEIYRLAADRDRTAGVLWAYELQFLRTGSPEDPVYAFTDISEELETMGEMARSSLFIWALGFAGFLVLSILLAHWAIHPVEQAWEQQRRFVADASHALKTPLTVVLTNAELLREQAEDDRQRQFSDSIVTMSHQMRSLVERMLQLARADSGQTAAERERLDCSALLEQALLPFEPLYFEAGLTLESDVRPGIMLTGNPSQLRQVAEILLDNALKYAAPGGTVRVTLGIHGSQCCLRVSSPGRTLTARQCRDIFKRFYRLDQTPGGSGGYGLGLAIAERIVADHRGRIWAEGKDGVNTFYVNLPIS